MAVTFMRELKGSGTIRRDQDGATAVRTFWIKPYGSSDLFARQVLGGSYKQGNKIVRRLPLRFAPGIPDLFALSVDIKGVGKPLGCNLRNGPNYSEGAFVRVSFGRANPFLTEEVDASASVMKIKGEALQWYVNGPTSGDKEIRNEDLDHVGLIVPDLEWRVTRHLVPQFSYNDFIPKLGTVNKTQFEYAAKETLLFAGVKIRNEWGSDLVSRHRMTLIFKWRRQGWNHAYRSESGQFERIVNKNDPQKSLYELAEHSTLVPEIEQYRSALAKQIKANPGDPPDVQSNEEVSTSTQS